VAETEIDGGATLGYCATGDSLMARMPPNMMRMETTHAKTGRSIKNLAMAVS
jgi:hypothetical protein